MTNDQIVSPEQEDMDEMWYRTQGRLSQLIVAKALQKDLRDGSDFKHWPANLGHIPTTPEGLAVEMEEIIERMEAQRECINRFAEDMGVEIPSNIQADLDGEADDANLRVPLLGQALCLQHLCKELGLNLYGNPQRFIDYCESDQGIRHLAAGWAH